ncbi:MAG: hypothetical protein ACFB2W_01990 [Leptolyngbyaceae cyanobacterium]
MVQRQWVTTRQRPKAAAISFLATAILWPTAATAVPVPYVSDEVGFNNAASRAQVDSLDTPWQTAAANIGATIITQNQIPAGSTTTISGNAHTLFTTASGITATTSLHDVTDTDLSIPNSVGSVATGNAQLSANNTLQGDAPRPASFYNTTAQPRYWNENSGSTISRNAVLFDFSEPVTAFGAWFGDLETNPDGTSAIVRLLDVNGNRIGDDIVVSPTGDPSSCGTTSFRGCGNRTTRWIGFVDDASQVKQMLVVVGDDAAGETGNREHISFIGATLAEKPRADLSITKTHSGGPFAPGDTVTYTITVTNQGPTDAVNIPLLDFVPSELSNVSWQCQIATPSGSLDDCQTSMGSGNTIYTRLSLGTGGSAEFTVQGTLLPTPPGTLTNVVEIGSRDRNEAAPGITDPDMTNNTASDDITVIATASGPPFICDGTFLLAQDENSRYFAVDTGNNQLQPLSSVFGNSFPDPISTYMNGIGFNVQDGYVYGVNPSMGNIYRLASDGTVTDLGNPTNLPNSVFSGDVDGNGVYYAHTGQWLYQVDVSGATAIRTGRIQLSRTVKADDVAFNPVNGLLYGFDKDNDVVVEINPATGQVVNFTTQYESGTTSITQAGASYFDVFGDFYAYQNNGGRLVRFSLDLPNNIALGSNYATGRNVSKNDGAACPYGPLIQKDVSTTTVEAGDTVTYTYKIGNQNPFSLSGVSFRDVLPSTDGRTYVSGSLVNPLGGIVNTYGNSQQLEIIGMNIPANQTAIFSVQVLIPSDTPPGELFNQAELENIPIGFGGPRLLSDYPPTGARPDPTPLTVTAPIATNPNVLLVKRITAINNSTSTTGDELSVYIDEAANPYDDNTITLTAPTNPADPPQDTNQWPAPANYLVGGINGGDVLSNDTIEYTIYFLSSGDVTAENVHFCDYIPEFTSFSTNGFNGETPVAPSGIPSANLGVEIFRNGSSAFYTGANDGDAAVYFGPGIDPANDSRFGNIDCDGDLSTPNSNTNGAIVVDLGNIINASAAGNVVNDAYGYVRFQAIVK